MTPDLPVLFPPLLLFPSCRSMYSVWKSLLEGTMQVAQSRLNICENYKNLISEPARTVRCFKEQQLKKVHVLSWGFLFRKSEVFYCGASEAAGHFSVSLVVCSRGKRLCRSRTLCWELRNELRSESFKHGTTLVEAISAHLTSRSSCRVELLWQWQVWVDSCWNGCWL